MQSFTRIWSSFRDFYNEINSATLTGAIDVLVIEQPDGSYVGSPFYVRFGKMGVLRSREKIVDIAINDQPVSLFMKLSDSGEAFFLEHIFDSILTDDVSAAADKDLHSGSGIKVRAASTSSTLGECGEQRPGRPKVHVRKRIRWPTESASDKPASQLRKSVSEGSISEQLVSSDALKPFEDLGKGADQSSIRLQTDSSSKFSEDPSLSQEDKDHLERVVQEGAALGKVLNDASDWKYERHLAKQAPSAGWKLWHLGGLIGGSGSAAVADDQDAVYLQDLERMSPSVADRYVLGRIADPPSGDAECKAPMEGAMLPSPRSADDVGYASHCGSDGDRQELGLAICDDLQDTLSLEDFHRQRITHEQLTKEPSVLRHPNLVVRVGDKLYRGDGGILQLVSLAVFNQPVDTGEQDCVSLIDTNGCSSSESSGELRTSPYSRRRRTTSGSRAPCLQQAAVCVGEGGQGPSAISPPIASYSGMHAMEQRSALSDSELEQVPLREVRRQNSMSKSRFKRSLSLSSELLKSLPLVAGVNKARFSVTTKYQGTCWCECHIFLWKWDDKLVITDIDGTITKSDVLGHILPIMGAQWTQAGVAELFNQMALNGYRIVYLSARAIGQSQWTKDYLRWIKQDKLSLPQGPLLLSPTSLIIALHREVIEKKPEVFKTGCLMEIRRLFPESVNPFYAGLGNRHNDVIAYTAVGVPRQRIFCINSSGEVESAVKIGTLSYRHLTDLADHFFPPLKRTKAENVLQSDFYEPMAYSFCNFWKAPLPELSPDELENFRRT